MTPIVEPENELRRIKIHREGTNILVMLALVLGVLNIPVWLFLPPVVLPTLFSALSVCVYGFVFNFFRCPKRHFSGDKNGAVVSSVDGKVVAVEPVFENEYIQGPAIQVSVFMSPLNVHANWFPVEGMVEYVRHHRGRFLGAYLPKASVENERSTIGIVANNGDRLTVRQVAGAMARRIVTYARPKQPSEINEHLGFIKFGSRVDIYLPPDAEVLVEIGQRTRGCVTLLARLQPKKS